MRRQASRDVFWPANIILFFVYPLQTYDPAEHPVEIALEWVECSSAYSCDAEAGILQPVILCEGEM